MTAVGASGPRRLGYGPLRDLIIGTSVISVDGVVSKAGGQVVKNVTGFDMMRLHHGGLGSLGVIVSINLKVIPKPQSERTVIAAYRSLDEADRAAREVVQSQLGVTAVVVTNPAATSEATGESGGTWAIAVRCEAPPSAVVRQAERVTEYVRDAAIDVTTEDSTDKSIARWDAICLALDQRQHSPDVSFRLGCAASRLGAVGDVIAKAFASVGAARITLDYGSGLAYVRADRDGDAREQIGGLYHVLREHGDHTTIMTAPTEFKRSVDVFGGAPAGFSMIEALKKTYDPDRKLNSGRAIGKL
jgi:glycolate oxidase FAD binding subunit